MAGFKVKHKGIPCLVLLKKFEFCSGTTSWFPTCIITILNYFLWLGFRKPKVVGHSDTQKKLIEIHSAILKKKKKKKKT